VAVADVKQVPNPPRGVTVIVTSSPGFREFTVKPVPGCVGAFIEGPELTEYSMEYPVAPVSAAQENCTLDNVDAPQVITGGTGGVMLKSNVAIESQPCAPVVVYVYIPASE
jgi:hypothetical protein